MGRNVEAGTALVFSSMGKWGHREGVDGVGTLSSRHHSAQEAGWLLTGTCAVFLGMGSLGTWWGFPCQGDQPGQVQTQDVFPFPRSVRLFDEEGLRSERYFYYYFLLFSLIDSWLWFLLSVGHTLPLLDFTSYWFGLQSEQESSSKMLVWDCRVKESSGLFQMLSLLFYGIQSRGTDALMQTCCRCKDWWEKGWRGSPGAVARHAMQWNVTDIPINELLQEIVIALKLTGVLFKHFIRLI